MECFIIFNDEGKYIGYCKKKKILKLFLKQRKNKHLWYKLNIEGLPLSLKNKLFNILNMLIVVDMCGENVALFHKEDNDFTEHLRELTSYFKYYIDNVFNIINFLNLNKSERKKIEDALCILAKNLDTFFEWGEHEYNDSLNIKNLFERFINEESCILP